MTKLLTFLQVRARVEIHVKILISVTAPQPQLQYSLFQQKIEMLQVNDSL